MYRIILLATTALGILALADGPSLASSHGTLAGSSTGNSAGISIGSTAHYGSAKPGTGAATPQVKKLSPKAASACYRACMHGMDSSMENFCGVSCF
jgi:hypothetical protein